MPGDRNTPNTYPPIEKIMEAGREFGGNLQAIADKFGLRATSLRNHLQTGRSCGKGSVGGLRARRITGPATH